ncbi:hypothetical protein PV327_011451, partial [Microctonus hyperodae]
AVRFNLPTEERICSGYHQKILHPKPEDCSGNSDPETLECSQNEQDVISEPTDFHYSQASTITEPTTSFEISPIQQSCSTLTELSLDITISSINQALSILNQSPIPTCKMNMKTFLNNKVSRVA